MPPRVVVVVTGGAQGIGLCLVHTFAGRGARVAFADVKAAAGRYWERRLRRAGSEVVFSRADLGRPADVRRFARTVLRTYGRVDVLVNNVGITEMGAPINARMGLNTWAAFVGTNQQAAIAGDVAMLASEVTPVLKALRRNGLVVVAIHHHMTTTQPTVYFLHYWGTGPVEKLAAGFKAALSELGR